MTRRELAKVFQLPRSPSLCRSLDRRVSSQVDALPVHVEIGHPSPSVAGDSAYPTRIVSIQAGAVPSVRARVARAEVRLPVVQWVAVDVVDSHCGVIDLRDEPVEQGYARVGPVRARPHVTLAVRPLDPKDQRDVLCVDDGRSAIQPDLDVGDLALYDNPRRSVADSTLTEVCCG